MILGWVTPQFIRGFTGGSPIVFYKNKGECRTLTKVIALCAFYSHQISKEGPGAFLL